MSSKFVFPWQLLTTNIYNLTEDCSMTDLETNIFSFPLQMKNEKKISVLLDLCCKCNQKFCVLIKQGYLPVFQIENRTDKKWQLRWTSQINFIHYNVGEVQKCCYHQANKSGEKIFSKVSNANKCKKYSNQVIAILHK